MRRKLSDTRLKWHQGQELKYNRASNGKNEQISLIVVNQSHCKIEIMQAEMLGCRHDDIGLLLNCSSVSSQGKPIQPRACATSRRSEFLSASKHMQSSWGIWSSEVAVCELFLHP